VAELFAGAEYSDSREKSLQRLQHALRRIVAWPFDRAAAREYGRVFATLKRKGRPMQQIDIQIAAIAITLGSCAVVTYDSDFGASTGLAVEFW
jgi:tRNA(fMet)-specific endonuclease VapC